MSSSCLDLQSSVSQQESSFDLQNYPGLLLVASQGGQISKLFQAMAVLKSEVKILMMYLGIVALE